MGGYGSHEEHLPKFVIHIRIMLHIPLSSTGVTSEPACLS